MVDIPSKFLCRITHKLMTDPVVDPDGNNYERSAIENWLKEQSRSPITYNPLTLNDLRPNDALRAEIQGYLSKQTSLNDNQETNVNEKSFELKVTSSWINDYVHISIEPPSGISIRAPCDICCVVDTSGSMSTEVTIQGAQNSETGGLSQLDIAKHALKTIVHSLTENDRLSIVSFSDNASILFKLTQMDDNGRSNALDAIEKLDENGATNLWDGLKVGLDVLTEGQRPSGSNVALFLLTDGCPSEIPPEGHLPALAEYKTKNNFTCSINTFGFGYSLDSKLLEDLAIMGNSGSYAFIPDGSFVGTIFVNAISNLLTTAATNLKLSVGGVQPPIDSSSIYICNYSTEISDHKFSDEFGLCFNLGSVLFGQSKDIIIPMTIDQYKALNIILDYETSYGEKKKQCKSIIKLDGNEKLLNQQKYRLEFVYYVRQGYNLLCDRGSTFIDNDPVIISDLQSLEERIKCHSTDDNYLTDLLEDLDGQVRQAFSRYDWFIKWGRHYLPSITRAHLLQQCNNFKDPGVQHYGQGDLFNTVRDEMDSMFCSLPAPVRRNYQALYDVNAPNNLTSTPTYDMSAFNNADNPCFHGSCTVKLLDGSIKFVKDIQRGDRLYPHGGTVNYILRTICNNKQAKMVFLDTGLIITPWHPIRLNAIKWIFPCSLVSSPINITCEAVYSFALDDGHTIWINDVECVTLGHHFKEDIVRHDYFGSEHVIEDLRILDGQQKCTGFIEIQPKWIGRNKRTGLVNVSYPIRLVSPVDNSDAYINIQWNNINSTNNVIQTIKFACETNPELRIISQQTLFRTTIDLKDLTMIKAYAEAYNKIVNNIFSRNKNKSKYYKNNSRELVHFIIKLIFEKENEYSFDLINELLTKFSIRSDEIFLYLGCSNGNILFQIAAMISCKKIIGIEYNSNLYHSAKIFEREFRFWMKWFGKSYTDFQIIQGDFFDENFRSILNSGNVIFVNNKSFSNDKNHNLKLRFYDLQSGSRIISTHPFGEPHSRVTARNINDIDSIMSRVLIENLKTNSQFTFYLQTIDYSRIEQYFHGINRKRNSNLIENEVNVSQTLFDVDISSSMPLRKRNKINNEEEEESSLIRNNKKNKKRK